jgi:hypothetical protein
MKTSSRNAYEIMPLSPGSQAGSTKMLCGMTPQDEVISCCHPTKGLICQGSHGSELAKLGAAMTDQSGRAPQVLAVIVLLAGLSAPGLVWAQQSTRADGQVTQAGAPRDIRPDSAKASKRSSTKQTGVAKKPAPTAAAPEPWTLEHALPGGPNGARRATQREVPTLSSPRLGRIPLETGSFGIETETQLKPNQFYDGRPTPGLETVKNNEPSYFGLSLSVPTNDPLFLPLLRPPE